jgi:hypothetical protein
MTGLDYYPPGFSLDWLAIVTVGLNGLSKVQAVADILQKLFTIAAIIVGAIWTYFNFFRGRTYKIRLEPEVSGKAVTINGLNHLVAAIRLKNVGLSRVEIEQKGTALELLAYNAPDGTKNIVSAAWDRLTAFPVFESNRWIEPGEMIEEKRLIVVPTNGCTAFRLRLRLVSHGSAWEAMDIVTFSEENASKTGGDDE